MQHVAIPVESVVSDAMLPAWFDTEVAGNLPRLLESSRR